ncbi:hypothetical protein [Croceiramulus getboli]|nr:hypothetical protein P8624_03960 [Flavobacteriaceae bacterium YJPT1-3]
MRYCITLFIAVLLMSCGEQKPESNANVDVGPKLSQYEVNLEGAKAPIVLIRAADTAAVNWKAYQELSRFVDRLDGLPGRILQEELKELQDYVINQLSQAVPVSLINDPILARAQVVNSHFNRLYMEVEKSTFNPTVVDSSAVRFYNSFQNLRVQMNQQFRGNIDDLLQDFEEIIQRERDSLAQLDTLTNPPTLRNDENN